MTATPLCCCCCRSRQVARIRGSEADHRKFYIETGNMTLRMKSETMCACSSVNPS